MNETALHRRPAAVARPRRVLVLGGTGEARALAQCIAAEPRLSGIVSLAGRVSAPLAQAIETRIGGFGGAAGLERWLRDNAVDRVLDATHPFAAQMSANARIACAAVGVPLAALTRPAWEPEPGDRWTRVADAAAAAGALGEAPLRVFLTIGRQGVAAFRAAPHHDYLLRVIEPPAQEYLPPRCTVFSDRGPFDTASEIALMRAQSIDVVVTKNSGGNQTYAKIAAARALGLEVVVIDPPRRDGRAVESLDEAMAFLLAPDEAHP